MSRTIIVPLDTTPASEVALPVAEALARHFDGSLRLFSVIEAPAEFAVWLRAEQTINAWVDRHVEVDAYLTGLAERFPDIPVETTVSTGNPSPEIVSFAAQQPDPLIVMASHARSGLERIAIGSVVASVLSSSPCPVIVARQPEEDAAALHVGAFDRLVVALDGSEFAEQALAEAQKLFGTSGLTIHLVRVVETTRLFGSTMFDMDYGTLEYYRRAAQEEAENNLKRVAGELEAAGHTVTWQATTGLVADEVNSAARAHNAGLIVMATHGRTGPARVILGSVAERVVHDADRPVFLVNPSAGE